MTAARRDYYITSGYCATAVTDSIYPRAMIYDTASPECEARAWSSTEHGCGPAGLPVCMMRSSGYRSRWTSSWTSADLQSWSWGNIDVSCMKKSLEAAQRMYAGLSRTSNHIW